MPSSCKDLRNSVAICLQRSPCVLIDRNTPKQCIENDELRRELPEKCRLQLASFYKCKHGLVDMRKRFRGNAPLSTGRYDEELAKLSSGNFNPLEEQAKLETPVATKEHRSGISPLTRAKEAEAAAEASRSQ